MHAYIHTYIHTYIHAYIHTYMMYTYVPTFETSIVHVNACAVGSEIGQSWHAKRACLEKCGAKRIACLYNAQEIPVGMRRCKKCTEVKNSAGLFEIALELLKGARRKLQVNLQRDLVQ